MRPKTGVTPFVRNFILTQKRRAGRLFKHILQAAVTISRIVDLYRAVDFISPYFSNALFAIVLQWNWASKKHNFPLALLPRKLPSISR